MRTMEADSTKHAAAFGWVGLLAVVAFAVTWLACFSVDPSWVWGTDSISRFGVSDTDAADYFRYGCIATGALLAVFGTGLVYSMSGRAGMVIAGVLFLIAGVCIILCGNYTLDYEGGDIHRFFAAMAGMLVLGASIAAAAYIWKSGHIGLGGIAVSLFMITFAAALAFGFEEFEAYAAVCGMIWIGLVGAYQVGSNLTEGEN